MAISDGDRLTRIERRQENLIVVIGRLADSMEAMNATLTELSAWLREPPSTDLPELIGTLVTTVNDMRGELRQVLRAVTADDRRV